MLAVARLGDVDLLIQAAQKEFQASPEQRVVIDLSLLFLRNVGRVLSRTHIRETVWGPSAAAISRTLDTHVSRVRNKVGLTPENGWRLAAMYRCGYRLERLAAPAQHAPAQHAPGQDAKSDTPLIA